MKKALAYVLLISGAASLLWGLYLFAGKILNERKTVRLAEEALPKMQEMIPDRVYGSVYASDTESQMPVMEINGLSLVGIVEMPEAGSVFVVQDRWGNPAVSRMKEGNVSEGTGVILTDQIAVDLVEEGMAISFTDINGIVYDFTVDRVCSENDIVQNAKFLLIDEGAGRTIQIACIEK